MVRADHQADVAPLTALASHLVCSGCRATPPAAVAYPARCPNAGRPDDIDHVLVRVLDAGQVRFPPGLADGSPFTHYRGLLHSYHRARAGGLTDLDFVNLVAGLDRSVADIDGRGFRATPFGRNDFLSERLGFTSTGGVWVKDETGNVAGSHKGRHLMGALLHLEVAERIGLADTVARPDLAIASCGNAALAAAVLARAGGRRLRVFVPAEADRAIVDRLRELGADVVACRRPSAVPVAGDPTYRRLREEMAAGALPFTCQGSENGLVIEGGETLAYEMVSELAGHGLALDHLVVQVGGGALASASMQAFTEAVSLGVLSRGPRAHTVQTTAAAPLLRCYRRIEALLPTTPSPVDIDRALQTAATHRSAYMWPWEAVSASAATGILDDETYDWQAVVGGMLATGGQPVVASELRLAEAHGLGRAAGFSVDGTGTAGLAGVLELLAGRVISPDERVAVLFTGFQP